MLEAAVGVKTSKWRDGDVAPRDAITPDVAGRWRPLERVNALDIVIVIYRRQHQ